MTKIEVIGNIGADAEVKNGEGYKFVSFRVADSQRWTDQAGKEHTQTDWYDCTLNNVESKIIPYLKRGTKVFIRGNARARLYSSAKERQMKATISINVVEIELLSGMPDAVPRELIDPNTGGLIKVTKFFGADVDTSKWKKEQFQEVIDKYGNLYHIFKGGWVTPVQTQEQGGTSESAEQQQVEQK